METTVDLQKMLKYSAEPMLIAGAVLAGVTVLLILMLLFKIRDNRKKHKKNTIKEILWTRPNLSKLQQEYLAKLLVIEERFKADPSNIRSYYEQMSVLIRDFAYRATGIEVSKYSLTEIKLTDMKGLAAIVEEYYEPEFDKISSGDVKSSIEKTRRLILEWK